MDFPLAPAVAIAASMIASLIYLSSNLPNFPRQPVLSTNRPELNIFTNERESESVFVIILFGLIFLLTNSILIITVTKIHDACLVKDAPSRDEIIRSVLSISYVYFVCFSAFLSIRVMFKFFRSYNYSRVFGY